MENKICDRCGENKPLDGFRKGKRDSRLKTCKACITLYIYVNAKFDTPIDFVRSEYDRMQREKLGRWSEKTCKICDETKPADQFRKNYRSGTYVQPCKKCRYKKQETSIRKSPERWEKRQVRDASNRRKYHRELRIKVLKEYGGFCVCCGETELGFLSIDHIQNDGAADRQIWTGYYFYRHLEKSGFPKDRYQILCHNCNMAKGFYGECPHKKIASNIFKSSHIFYSEDFA